jgi:hypothetical protein
MKVIDIKTRANPEREKEKMKMAENVIQSMIDTDNEGGPAVVAFAMENASKEENEAIDKWIWQKVREESEGSDPFMYNLIVRAAKSTMDMGSWPEERMDVIGQNGNDGEHYDD